MGIATTILEKWSMMFRITLQPLEAGSGLMRLTEITSQGCEGGMWEWRAVEVGSQDILFSWQAVQPFTYRWTSCDRPGQKKVLSIRFWVP